MLFGREYMPEGASVDPDAPRKKGAARLWEILSRDLDGHFCLRIERLPQRI